jgi:hypothetical protein
MTSCASVQQRDASLSSSSVAGGTSGLTVFGISRGSVFVDTVLSCQVVGT